MSEKRRLTTDLDALLAVPEQAEPQPLRRIDWDGNSGTLTTPPQPADLALDDDFWAAELTALGYDPAKYRVVDAVRTSVWEAQTPQGIQTLRSIRARVVPRQPGLGIDADALIAEIRKHKPRKRPEASESGGAMIWCCSDIQIGKSDGDSLDGTVARFLQAITDTERRVKELRRTGRQLDHLVIACLGDLIEGCDGHYPAQAFNVSLNRREQIRVMRRLLLKAVERLAPLFPQVTIAAVAGNHGEYRGRGGKAFTDPGLDNDDLAVPEQVLEILAENPDAYGHVVGAIGGDPFTRVLKAGGHVLGMLHGHMARESGPAQQKIMRWFERQAAAKAPISAADVVLSGHYHHFSLNESNGRVTFASCPALDGGSDWYRAEKAAQHRPGLLTFALYPDNPRVTDIAVL